MDLTREGIVTTEEVDGVLLVHFQSGRMRDEREVLRVLDELGKHVEATAACKVLVDMENIEYLSSAGLGLLVGALKKSRKNNGSFKLCRLQESIVELFEVMRLTKIFELFDSRADALKTFDA